VLPLALDDVPVGNTTRGHRFLSEGEIAVEGAADYLDKLERAYVVLDHDRRRDLIAADLDRLAAAEGVTVKPDPGLLDEVAGLVEFPVVLIGAIDDASMALPPEVLATAMRTHQKYFSCLKADGAPAPRFLFVANNLTPDDGKTIVAGNERVLKARLADARFFWDQDRKVPLASRVDALKDRVYYEKLGTVFDKVVRIEQLARFLVPHVFGADETHSRRAALLSKADLSTGMVGEFPELQGVIGRYYALYAGNETEREDARVANAIADHYKPLGPSDSCPTAPDSVVVAIADKFDALAAFFAIGEKPTGSRDPFALRRAALGAIRLILENGLRLNLKNTFEEAAGSLQGRRIAELESGESPGESLSPNLLEEVLAFTIERLKVHLREQGVRHDLIAAVFALEEYDLVRLLARVAPLQDFLASEDGTDLLIAYRRASNIVNIEARKGGWTQAHPEETLFRQSEETALAERLDEVMVDARDALERDDFQEAMRALAMLRKPVDEFFDKVTVNTDAEEGLLRQNRLRLLSRIQQVMNQVADFSQIEG